MVQYVTTYSFRHGSGKEKEALSPQVSLSNAAEKSEALQFIADILPKKILAGTYLKMLKEKREEEGRRRRMTIAVSEVNEIGILTPKKSAW